MRFRLAVPFMLSIAMAIGFWMGSGLKNPLVVQRQDSNWKKIDEILRYVEDDYVDTVSRQELEDEVIAYLLQRLDPHSYYIEGRDVQAFNEPLEGGFEGIGVQFSIRQDTVYVISTIKGGPAERAGMQASDRLLMVDSTLIAGNGITNQKVMKLLKGPAGSEVNVSVKRLGASDPVAVTIQRGEIPLTSIDAVYKVDATTLYVRLARFALTTTQEFEDRVVPFADQGIEHIILDLRGNGGGFLDAAIALADEFLPDGKLVTYTEGRSRPRQDFYATGDGHFESTQLSILMDGYSASASEIMAGAIQDHDRGNIIGKRSFGKGLVQEQNQWPDGSATRLTVARYFTPDGRSIQRPYEGMPETEYEEHARTDSTHQGGIIPDISVGNDTAGVSWLYAEIVHRGLLNDFAYHFRDQHLNEFMQMEEAAFLEVVTIDSISSAMRTFLGANQVVIDEGDWNRSSSRMANRALAIVARSLFGEDLYFEIINRYDPYVGAAIEGIKKPEA